MTKNVQHMFLIGYLLLIALRTHAQDNERKWAINYSGSAIIHPVLTSNLSDHSTGRGFRAFTLLGEYYLPKKWSAEAGYFRTEVSYGGNSRTMEGIQLGVRRYFIRQDFFIQPYATAATQFNWGRHIEKSYVLQDNYLNSQFTKNPKVSFAPGVGADIFFFSSIAFMIKYNFNMGINSKTFIDAKLEDGMVYSLKDRGLYHNLELGIKVTFPFRISKQDGWSLFDMFWGQ